MKMNGVAAFADPVHVLVQLFTSLLRKSCGGLVDDYDLRVKICRFYNLYQLSVLEIVIIDDIGCLDALSNPYFFQELRCLLVHGVGVLDSHMYELVFMAQEDIFSATVRPDRVPSSCTMMDTPSFISLNLVFRMDFFSIQYKGTAVDAVDAGQHVGQR